MWAVENADFEAVIARLGEGPQVWAGREQARAAPEARAGGTETQNGDTMGFNAMRRYRDGKALDIGLLVIGMAVLATLLSWGFGLIG
ncbi:MAG: hypothetical protein M3N32_03100 [Actinomycetota bacterium]|nr:hypothetical protein [Actinomycetota bacterium]